MQIAEFAEQGGVNAAAATYCANVLRPDLDEAGKRKLANDVLSLGDNQVRAMPKKRITPATVEEMFFRQAQCIRAECPLWLFSEQLAEELNEFFSGEPTLLAEPERL